MWGISIWADDTLHRWSNQNLAPKEDSDITFEQEEEDSK